MRACVLIGAGRGPSERMTGRARRSRRGFTLLEVTATLVVVTVLATLATIGGARVIAKSQDSAAGTLLHGVAAAEQMRYSSRGMFVDDPAAMSQLSSTGRYVAGSTAATAGVVSVTAGTVGGSDAVGLATVSDSGQCFTLVTYAPDAGISAPPVTAGSGVCSGAAALAAAATP